jgi:DNA polymerase-3 subunit alpha
VNNDENLETISRVLVEDGKTEVNFNMNLKDKTLKFKLKKTRNLDRKSLNLLRKREISSTII